METGIYRDHCYHTVFCDIAYLRLLSRKAIISRYHCCWAAFCDLARPCFSSELAVRFRRWRYHRCGAGFCYLALPCFHPKMVLGTRGYTYRSSRAGFRYLVRSYFLSEMVVRTGGCRYYLCQAEFSYLALLCILPLDGLGNSRVQVSPFSRRILLLCIPVLSVWNALENQTI